MNTNKNHFQVAIEDLKTLSKYQDLLQVVVMP